MNLSAGCLLYRETCGGAEVLIVHPSGSYNRGAPWSIPKGLIDPGEQAEQAARRETVEETGVEAGELTAIGHIDYRKSRKRVFCFVGAAPDGAEPRCASWEIDNAQFLPLDQARQLLHVDQQPFVDRLSALLEEDSPE